jgi:uncharacterized coiled-coil protein SlyX
MLKRISGVLSLVLIGAVACERGPSPEMVALSAQKDSLVQEIVGYAGTMSDISAELAKMQAEGSALVVKVESPTSARKDTVMARIAMVSERLAASERRLAESRTRIRRLTGVSDSLRATLDRTVTNYEATIASQKATIDDLTQRVAALRTENAALTVAKNALTDTVRTLATENNTVYYVIGTKQELLERGIVTEEGGSRVLFIFGRAGKTLVPARQLEPTGFTAIDMRTTAEIPLPDANSEYRIASRQDLSYLATQPDDKGRIKAASLKIAQPQQFWQGSRYLIIVRG